MRRLRIFQIVIGAVLLAVLGVLGYVAIITIVWLGTEDTRYAPGYSEASFQQIRSGMSESEVRTLLGDPLHIYEGGEADPYDVLWIYSDSPSDWNYHMRWVLFEDDIVRETRAEFYRD